MLHVLTCLPWLALLAWLAAEAWFLCDDAFISFRYVRNLIEGHGLVFNPGERVEGYTNFLWVLELAALWGALGLRPEHAAPWLSVACTAATIGVVLWWVIRIPDLQQRRLILVGRAGSAVQQCDLRRLDFRWRVGNTTVHVVCCSGHRLCHGARR